MSERAIQVLLVEDSTHVAERMRDLIDELAGCELRAIVDGESAAVASLYKWPIDLILLDLHLRQGSGFGVLRALADLNPRPRVIVITNHNHEEYQTAATTLGATHFLDKARDFHRLPDIIREIAGAAPLH